MQDAHTILPTTATVGHRIPFKPGALSNVRVPDDAQLSPDGKRIAFVLLERATPNDAKRTGRIWLVNTSSGEPQPFIKSQQEESCPRWSPDNKWLAYIAKGEGEKEKEQLYLISTEGGEPKKVCTMPNGVSDLAWSPDSGSIAFLSLEGAEPATDPIVVMPGRHRRLWTVRPDHAIPEAVTPDDVTIWEYAWSPDGKQLALYYSTGPDETDWYRGQIGVVPASGGAVRQLTHLTRQASSLAWSPDNTQLTYVSGEWSDPGRGSGDIFLLTVTDGHTHNLTPNIETSPHWCAWYPSGQDILFTACAGVTHQIAKLNMQDGAITLLVKDFVMQGDQPSISPTADLHAFATIHSCQQHLPDVWYGERSEDTTTAGNISWRQLSRLNPLIEETVAVAQSTRIRYGSVDGWQIDGLFTLPLNYKRDTPLPLFVNIHGGLSGAWSDDWGLFYTQMLASAGYAVLRPDIRGSWGRGVAFADAVFGDMGGKEFQDILYGVEYLVEQQLVDGNRVAIGGWSYGGYIVAWAVTQTNRFKASIMGAGISDWLNMHAQTRLADADIRQLATDPLEHPEVYYQHSPMTFAGRVVTPTLILHGENDPDVPVAQAYAFYRALRERNVPVELVVYPREGHGLRERLHAIDSEERVLRWLERYV
ncbi:MAG: S9 family peptidase [Ktedonobacteraceae bacterium]